jgi:hypothetical protein
MFCFGQRSQDVERDKFQELRRRKQLQETRPLSLMDPVLRTDCAILDRFRYIRSHTLPDIPSPQRSEHSRNTGVSGPSGVMIQMEKSMVEGGRHYDLFGSVNLCLAHENSRFIDIEKGFWSA